MYPGGGDSVIGKAALSGTETASSSRLGRIGGSRGIWKTERDGIVQAGVEMRQIFPDFAAQDKLECPEKYSRLLKRTHTFYQDSLQRFV